MLVKTPCFCGFPRFRKLVKLIAQGVQQPAHVLMRHLTAINIEHTVFALDDPNLSDQFVNLALQPGQIVFHADCLMLPNQIRKLALFIAARALLHNPMTCHFEECV